MPRGGLVACPNPTRERQVEPRVNRVPGSAMESEVEAGDGFLFVALSNRKSGDHFC